MGSMVDESGSRWFTGRDQWYIEDESRPPDVQTALGSLREPAREVPIHDDTDVLVVGGGPAGCAAAVAARRLGARVTLIERYNHLGGLSTGGLVIWIDRMTDWSGQQVIAGFAREILDRLPPGAVAGSPRELWGSQDPAAVSHWRNRLGAFRNTVTWSPMIDPEQLKYVSAELMEELGVRLLFHSWAVAVVKEGRRVNGVIFESKQGRRAVRAKVVVDTTGDLDVCAFADIPYESDVEAIQSSGNVQHCVNTAFTWAGVDFERWLAFRTADQDAFRQFVERVNEELGFAEMPHVSWRDDAVVFMGPRLAGYSALRVDDLTRVEIESRRRMMAHLQYFRSNAPGFEHAWVMLSAPQVGVRHTRRLIGTHPLVSAEWQAGVRHEDEIGVSPSPSAKFPNISVPYGALIPVHLDNVVVGGRHVASDAPTQSFMREIPQCWMTGHAAGVAAALAADRGDPLAALDVGAIRAELLDQGAYLQSASESAAR